VSKVVCCLAIGRRLPQGDGVPTINYSLQNAGSGSGDWLPAVIIVWGIVWLLNLAIVLKRSDYDPITRLTWVLVLILVPFFGILLYWFIAPDARSRVIYSADDDTGGTPWKGKPGYTLKSK
jgi:hypothetical protein